MDEITHKDIKRENSHLDNALVETQKRLRTIKRLAADIINDYRKFQTRHEWGHFKIRGVDINDRRKVCTHDDPVPFPIRDEQPEGYELTKVTKIRNDKIELTGREFENKIILEVKQK